MLACFFRKYYCRDVTFSRPPIISRDSIFRNSVISFPIVADVSSNAARFLLLRKNFTHKSLHSWRNLFRTVVPAHLPDALPASAGIVIRTVRKTRRRRRRIRTWGISVLSVVTSAAKRRKNDVYERKLTKRKAKNFYSFPKLRQSRSYLLAGKRSHRSSWIYKFRVLVETAPSPPSSLNSLPSRLSCFGATSRAWQKWIKRTLCRCGPFPACS